MTDGEREVNSQPGSSAPQVVDSDVPSSDDSGSMFTGMDGTVSTGQLSDLIGISDMTITAQFSVDSQVGQNTIASAATDLGDLQIVVANGRVSGGLAGSNTANIPIEVGFLVPLAFHRVVEVQCHAGCYHRLASTTQQVWCVATTANSRSPSSTVTAIVLPRKRLATFFRISWRP